MLGSFKTPRSKSCCKGGEASKQGPTQATEIVSGLLLGLRFLLSDPCHSFREPLSVFLCVWRLLEVAPLLVPCWALRLGSWCREEVLPNSCVSPLLHAQTPLLNDCLFFYRCQGFPPNQRTNRIISESSLSLITVLLIAIYFKST